MTSPSPILIAGGGLAGGLIARALARRADAAVLLVEPGEALGGNHVWSFFDTDVDAADRWLVEDLVAHRWPAYDVRFPGHQRTIAHGYNSIESERFDRVLRAALGGRVLRDRVVEVGAGHAVLARGGRIEAAVIDARGAGDLSLLRGGWQKFVGLTIRTERPHGVERPVVMDATVEQIDGYRFVYVLPFGPHELFVEDTYYSDTPELDADAIRDRVLAYAATRGWAGTPSNRLETGVLPVISGGDFAAYWGAAGAKAGMRAGLCQPTTGYSLPDAVRLAARIGAAADLSADGLARLTHAHARDAWRARGFYRLLDRMLFGAAAPDQRYRVLERFYRLSPDLIGRFYAARSTLGDRVRILAGKPPVPISRAVKAILS